MGDKQQYFVRCLSSRADTRNSELAPPGFPMILAPIGKQGHRR